MCSISGNLNFCPVLVYIYLQHDIVSFSFNVKLTVLVQRNESSKHVYPANLQYKTSHGLRLFKSIQVLTIMDPLSCDNAIYEEVKVASSHEGLDIHENNCYGKVISTATNKHEEKNRSYTVK